MIQKKITDFLFSTRLMAILFIAYAVAMGIGTFLENDYGTTAARIWIYNARWFEVIMGLFLINFFGNIYRYRLFKKEKLPTLVVHLAFVFILIGAAITRYISYEGIMPIREGVTTNKFLSTDTYLTTYITKKTDSVRRKIQQKLELSAPTQRQNRFVINTDFKGQEVLITYDNFIQGAEEGLRVSDDGDLYLKMVEAGKGKRHDHFLKEGEVVNIHNILFAFNKPTQGAINISYNNKDNYTIKTPFTGSYLRMADQLKGNVIKDSVQPLQLRSLYQLAGTQFVFPDPVTKGVFDIIESPIKEKGQQDALIVNVTSNGETQKIKLLGAKGVTNDFKEYEVGDLQIAMRYGSKELKLPFSLKLNDFIATKYPGTETGYAAFKSKVDLIEEGQITSHEIFMNNVLDYKGFRFFQASFDADERGTVLSVNHDFWGTWITYIGYTLLYIGLMMILLFRGSRFKALESKLNGIKLKKASLVIVALFTFLIPEIKAQTGIPTDLHLRPTKKQIDSLILANKVDKIHAAKFGRIIVQDEGGRMKPVNTFGSELLRKLSKRDNYEGLDGNQVLISMMENPIAWYNIPLIYIDKKNDSIRKILGTPKGEKRVALVDLFDKQGNYKLEPYLREATSTNTPNQFEKDFVKTHEKFFLLNSALSGSILRVFPIPNNANNKWVSPPALNEVKYSGMDSVYTRQILPLYRQELQTAKKSGDYEKAEYYLNSISKFQQKYGSEVIPNKEKIDAELFLNKYDIFRTIYQYYFFFGFLMLFWLIIQIFWDKKFIRVLIQVFKVLVALVFVVHTGGLVMRWYVSGHAPWSDAYESMIYVAWATQFFGLALGRKSNLTIAATAFVTSIILVFAHQNWLDPSIANLQPVLDSYWLMIHVAVIVASYGPFILGSILGVISLLLMVLTTTKNKTKMKLNIEELTIVTEMSLTIGLVMLTIGNFLGGQWANESWGRYWGWDPKETWALVSIMIYAFVIHMRLVPGLRGKWTFNFAAMIAVSTVLMTYFGVNFYLSGLHSYASGTQPVTPTLVWKALGFFIILGGLSFWRYKVHYKK